MAVDPAISSLLRALRVLDDAPYLPPKTWESSSESSGISPASARLSSQSIADDPSAVSEAAIVRLVINALQGVKAALDAIEKISAAFSVTPADGTTHRVPNFRHRPSSTRAVGKLLKSFWRSGYIFFLLIKFVDHFLNAPVNQNDQFLPQVSGQGGKYDKSHNASPPYTLVNQAFAVALRNILKGYVSSLNTLSASAKLRRSQKGDVGVDHTSSGFGSLTSIVLPEVTILEVYLHTKELRTSIEALGNICCLSLEDIVMPLWSGKNLHASSSMSFDHFPRGADLLTYLNIQLRDSDPVHHGILKYLFACSCEPYFAFIKSWIYKAKLDDPYKEFIVYSSTPLNSQAGYRDVFSLASTKEQDDVSVPCFLDDICPLLFRCGQQLHILIKLIDICHNPINDGYSIEGVSAADNLASSEDVLPCWSAYWSNSVSDLSSLTFGWEDLRKMTTAREDMYKTLSEKREDFFKVLNARIRQIKCSINCCDFIPSFHSGSKKNNFLTSASSDLNFSSFNTEQEAGVTTAELESTTISSASDDSFCEMDSLQLSDSSLLDSSEEESGFEETGHSPGIALGAIDISASTEVHANENQPHRPFQTNKPLTHEPEFKKKYEKEEQIYSIDEHFENEKISLVQISNWSADKRSANTSEFSDDEYQCGRCWPLGGLMRNPFHAEKKYTCQRHMHFDRNTEVADEDAETLQIKDTTSRLMILSDNLELKPPSKQLKKDISANCRYLSSTEVYLPGNCLSNYNLGMNPMLTKAAQLRAMYGTINHNFACNNRPVSYLDFSSVDDPCKIFLEKSAISNTRHYDGNPVLRDSADLDTKVSGCVGGDVLADQVIQSYFDSASCSTRDSGEFLLDKGRSGSVCGGAKWTGLLRYSGDAARSSNNMVYGSMALSEIPLDVILDRCIIQEVLLQYKYVSHFTIRLLVEGFGLKEHLLALRRYYFMELADWADSFTISLWKHKWYITEPNQRIAEIQSLLDLALQRSSCESDPYRQRLFIYSKEQSNTHFSNNAIGAFNFMLLGYKVDWPISIVVHQEALKVYSDIFSFLMEVRLALFTLTDVWHSLKGLMHPNSLSEYHCGKNLKDLATFTETRLEVNHFVITLQQYVQSQLSDAWSRFLVSLEHQVDDMLDLEALHMSYLVDALHICFLSSEEQPISSLIRRILQCAMDFRFCLATGHLEMRSDISRDSASLFAHINFSQVLAIKATFERDLKDLFLFYLKSPKHAELGLCCFWSSLNYNNFYSNKISREMRCVDT